MASLDWQGYGIRFDLYSIKEQCGVTNITESTFEHVIGILFDVPTRLVFAPKGQRRMDEIEGAQPDGRGNYRRIPVNVQRADQNIDAFTYVGTDAGRERFKCRTTNEQCVSKAYFGHLQEGAKAFRFPPEYVGYLERQADH